MSNTVKLHRVLNAPPEKVYRAFTDPDAIVKWMPPHGFTAKVEQMDVRVGGSYKMSFTNFTTNKSHSFGGDYVKLVPGELIQYTDKFDDPKLEGEIKVTIDLQNVTCGTDLKITQEGLPDLIPVDMCYLGWQESLNLLALLVEPDIDDDQ